jgi:methyl-accepting chemotaxis protein
MFDRAPLPALAPELRHALPDIHRLIAELDDMAHPCEQVFLTIGETMGQAMGALNSLEADFTALAGRLESGSAVEAENSLSRTVRQCGVLAEESAATSALLIDMETAARTLAPSMASLKKIMDEVGSLAINGRVQAAHVQAMSMDFSVFTTEMGRLHTLADGAVGQAANRLRSLLDQIDATRTAEQALRGSNTGDLSKVRDQLARGLNDFDNRRQRSRAAMISVSGRSHQIAAQVAQCIRRMQINDLTRQRLEHVRKALEMLSALIDGGPPAEAAWAGDLDGPHKVAMAAEVCRLQAVQVERAVGEFATEVAQLKASIQTLSGEAAAIGREARTLFEGSGSTGSFLAELEADTDAALTTLGTYAETEGQVLGMIGSVSAGFHDMVGDMDAIHSIDADMRVMGLNATLKCGRLGQQGRALGVVAQELRACSRRTQEVSATIASSIAAAGNASDTLAERARQGHANAEALRAAIGVSMTTLRDASQAIFLALDDLVGSCTRVSQNLGDTAGGLSIHLDMQRRGEAVLTALNAMTRMSEATPGLMDRVRDDVRELLEGHYTMASERVVHGLIATSDAAAAEVDDFFF